jgi:hypothetical protein
MKINIAPSRKISEIQEEFNREFPFLKLEFFNNKSHQLGAKRETLPVNGSQPLSKCQSVTSEGVIQFSDATTVKDLEKVFRENFHVQAQVFRHSGSLWLETTLTDQWTLKKQNEHGKELSQQPEKEQPEDYDLMRD